MVEGEHICSGAFQLKYSALVLHVVIFTDTYLLSTPHSSSVMALFGKFVSLLYQCLASFVQINPSATIKSWNSYS